MLKLLGSERNRALINKNFLFKTLKYGMVVKKLIRGKNSNDNALRQPEIPEKLSCKHERPVNVIRVHIRGRNT